MSVHCNKVEIMLPCNVSLISCTLNAGFHIVADGTFPTAKRLVLEILDDCPVKTICAFFHKSWRYMDAYGRYRTSLIDHHSFASHVNRNGLNTRQAEFAVKKYKSNRRCGPMVMMNVDVLLN